MYKFKADANNPLKICPIIPKKDESDYNAYMLNDTIPRPPFSLCVSGSTGSGKSQTVLNLLLNKQLLQGYFDEIYLISQSPDELLEKSLHIKKERVLRKSDKHIITFLTEFLEKFEEDDDQGKKKKPRVLFIFEDFTSRSKLMRSQQFIDLCVYQRHCNVSIICIIHKYKSLIRVARLNMGHFYIFPCMLSEQLAIIDDFQGSLSKDEMLDMFKYIFTKTTDNERPFLNINTRVPYSKRFRKSLDEIMEIDDD